MNIFGDTTTGKQIAPVLRSTRNMAERTKKDATRGPPSGQKASRETVTPEWVHEVLTKKDLAHVYSAIADISKRGYNYPKTSDGKYIIESDNKFVFTNGNFENPSIDAVISIDTHYSGVMQVIREALYENEARDRPSLRDAVRLIDSAFSLWADIYSADRVPKPNETGKNKGRSDRDSKTSSGKVVNYHFNDDGSVTETLVDRPGKHSRELDTAYMDAVERGDMETAQRMVNEAAEAAGYTSDVSWRMQHTAPNAEDDVSLFDLEESGLVPNDYWAHPEWYTYSPEERDAFYAVRRALELQKKHPEKIVSIRLYRAVDKTKNKREERFRNGDWVTPSKSYAENEGRMNPNGYRLIGHSAPLNHVYWDGNSIAELGYDDGENYAYADTANNRKLLDPVVYDYDGLIVPLSKRFSKQKFETFYSREVRPYAELQEENRELRSKLETATRTVSYWRGQTKRTTRATLRQGDVDKLTRNIIKGYYGTIDIKNTMKREVAR